MFINKGSEYMFALQEDGNGLCIFFIFSFLIIYMNNCKKCCRKTPYELGLELINLGAEEEGRLAQFLRCESEKIECLIDKAKKNHCCCDKITGKDLIEVNKCIKSTLCHIAIIEKSIFEKIKVGKELMSMKNCHCPIPPSSNNSCDDENYDLILSVILVIFLINRSKMQYIC